MEGSISHENLVVVNESYMGTQLGWPERMDQRFHQLAFHQQHQFHPRQESMTHPSFHASLPQTIGSNQQYSQTIPVADYSNGNKGEVLLSNEYERNNIGAVNGHNDRNRGKEIPWQRVKWTDPMVRILITAVSYVDGESLKEYDNMRSKSANLQKKGKWKSISKVMAERAYFVSPQQCEDKFNDLNKRYKRLNEIIGRGTSCNVVENPALLNMMDHISEKTKAEVRKILSSKHLYYKEMCSHNSRNRLNLPPDPELEHSLRLALGTRDDDDMKRPPKHNIDEDIHNVERYAHKEIKENHALHKETYGRPGVSAKRMRECMDHSELSFDNCVGTLDCCNTSYFLPQSIHYGVNQTLHEGVEGKLIEDPWMKHCSLLLEEQRLLIQAQRLELEKDRWKWLIFCKKRDGVLEMMRMENGRIKLGNEHMAMALVLKQKEIGSL